MNRDQAGGLTPKAKPADSPKPPETPPLSSGTPPEPRSCGFFSSLLRLGIAVAEWTQAAPIESAERHLILAQAESGLPSDLHEEEASVIRFRPACIGGRPAA